VIKRGKRHDCFQNAGRAILSESNPALRYCEGYLTVGPVKAHHAWIENGETGELHEVTIPKTFSLRGIKTTRPPREQYVAVVRLSKPEYVTECFKQGIQAGIGPLLDENTFELPNVAESEETA